MSWNDPGGGNRDPWGGRRGEEGPPDLDEVARKFKKRFKQLFRKGDGGGGDDGDGGGSGRGGPRMIGIAIIVVVLLIIWLASGFYVIEQGWRGVETRFGEYTRTTLPGLHWHLPWPIEDMIPVNVRKRRRITVGYEVVSPGNTRLIANEARMLTKDENIVSVQLVVQYHVSDPTEYLFTFRNPEQTLNQVTQSALRQVVGKHKLSFILTRGRAEVAAQTRKVIEDIIERYDIGLEVVVVAVQDIQPPEPVQPAFADVNRAREDKQRLINQAQAYRNSIIPKAQGKAARIGARAEAYKAEVIARAKGVTSRFLQIASEYAKAPEITRKRLYLETLEEVLAKTGKVVVGDTGGAQPLMFLPLDRMQKRSRRLESQSKASGNKPEATNATSAVSSTEGDKTAFSRWGNRSHLGEVHY